MGSKSNLASIILEGAVIRIKGRKVRQRMVVHVHKYRRINLAKKGNPEHWVMHCSLPNCNHYTVMQSKLSCKPLWGKHSICNNCSAPFELDKRSLRQANPTCIDCYGSEGKKAKLKKAENFFNQLEKGLTP